MRRDQLIRSLEKISLAVDAAGIKTIFNDLRTSVSPDRAVDPAFAFKCFSSFMGFYSSFSPDERHLLAAFGLDYLKDETFWAKMVDKESKDFGDLSRAYSNSHALDNAIEKFIPLLRRASDEINESIDGVSPKGDTKKLELQNLTFIIKEDKSLDLSVDNLIDILNYLKILYNTTCTVFKIEHTELFVGSIDSGSDKSIDVIGIAQAIDKLSGFILEGWDRFRFRKEQKLEKSLKSMSEGISLVEKIHSAMESGSLSAEEAEKLKRNVVKSIDGLVNNGVYTLDAENKSLAKPSEIAVERRLMITYEDPANVRSAESNKVSSSKTSTRKPKNNKRTALHKNSIPE